MTEWFLIYWGICYYWLLGFVDRHSDDPIGWKLALALLPVSLLTPWIAVGSFIGKMIAAGRGPDDT